MNTHRIELLESRIAPASIVTLTLTGHDLLISGDNNGANVDVEQSPNGEWVFTSPSDTKFKVGAAAPAATVFLKGVTGTVTGNLGSGSDTLDFHDIHFGKDLTVNTGGGGDTVRLTAAKVTGSVSVNGGINGTNVLIDGLTVGHNLSIQAGDGQNFFDTNNLGLTVGGDCTFIGGSSADSALFNGGPVKIKGNLKLDGGSDGVSTFTLTPNQLSVGGALTILDGMGDSTFSISPGGTLKVGGALEVHNGFGSGDPVAIGKGSHLVMVGGNLLVDEPSADRGDVEIVPAGLLQIAVDLTVNHGGGDASTVTVRSDVVRIGGGVSVTSNLSVGSPPHISFGAATSFSVAKNFSVQAGEGNYDVRLQTPGALTIGGGIDIHAGGGVNKLLLVLLQAGTAHIAKDVSAKTNDALFAGGIGGGAWAIGGSLTFHSDAKLSESQNYVRSLKVGHDLTVSGGTGLGFFSLYVRGALNVGGNLAITAGADANETVAVVPGSGKIAGNATVMLSGSTASITFGGHAAPLSIGGFAEFDAIAQTSSTTLIQGLTVKGNLTFAGILGDDTASFDDLVVSGKTTINTGSGQDTINVETRATLLHRASTFSKDVQIELGASMPATLTIGIAGAAEHRATFGAAALFDGGSGATDTLNQRNALFLKSGAPTINGFELFG